MKKLIIALLLSATIHQVSFAMEGLLEDSLLHPTVFNSIQTLLDKREDISRKIDTINSATTDKNKILLHCYATNLAIINKVLKKMMYYCDENYFYDEKVKPLLKQEKQLLDLLLQKNEYQGTVEVEEKQPGSPEFLLNSTSLESSDSGSDSDNESSDSEIDFDRESSYSSIVQRLFSV
jgi:hypothetical protein